ncbi:MAG: ribulose-phosphate 3-epimerase [Bacteroidales bacterium]|nr:ribulose-phosphate 3-epimerase [Bacteroidales bacterium]MBQ9713661.1 ribulose-phosphate 3-epimerase [Bacteroidales bacterium]
MRKIAPSILAADFLNLGKDVEFVNGNADIFHLDVMDGTFVPNLSFGFPVIEAIASKATKPLDVHLMIVHPEKYIDRFAKVGASMISFHLEAAMRDGSNPNKIIDQIHSHGVKAGLAINPDVPVEELFQYLDDVDFVLLMSVFAGFGGQKFIPDTLERVKTVKDEITRLGLPTLIEVDGGVDCENCDALSEAGVDLFVAGSTVFKAEDRVATVKRLRGE